MSNLHVIVGLGVSGLSCVRYLSSKNIPIAVTDSRLDPPALARLKKEYPDVEVALGELSEKLLDKAATVVMSPGVSLKEPVIAKQIARGIPVIGDIELFAQAVKAPVVAITGSNAKSTVTTLVGLMAQASGWTAKVGGNLGTPALDLLMDDTSTLSEEDKVVYILELSSFQLETTFSLAPKVAAILNITPDHMDRYADFQEYVQAKQRIYQHCEFAVCNRDDENTECGEHYRLRRFYSTLNEPVQNEFGLLKRHSSEFYLSFGNQLLLPIRALPIRGRHYHANALAALAIGHALGLPMSSILTILREFKGLPHRCQLVREAQGISWYNDSKGTNVGATLAAVEGLGSGIHGKLILIAGGVGKDADFTPLTPAVTQYVRTAILIGEAAPLLAETLGDACEVIFAKNMDEAIQSADQKAHPGDSVLLSPACASFDMFKNYEHRGEVFTQLVQGLTSCGGR